MNCGVLVLAAGKSTRIRSVALDLPKPLLPIADRPIIGRNLEWLATYGIQDVWVNLHYQPDVIREALGDGSRFGVRIHYSIEPEILGTAGAWKHLGDHWTGTSLVVYGDNLLRVDLERLGYEHRRGGMSATIALFDPSVSPNSGIAGGRVQIDGGARVTEFVEGASGATGGLVNAGVYLLEPAILQRVLPGFQDFSRDVFPELVAVRQLGAYVMSSAEYCLGLDTPESFAKAQTLINLREVVLT